HQLASHEFDLVGRDQVLGRIASEFLRREVMHPIRPDEIRMGCRHICLHAYAGGGKSRIIDHLCHIKGDLMDFVKGGEQVSTLRQALNDNTVYVPIQFKDYDKGHVFDQQYLDENLRHSGDPKEVKKIISSYFDDCAMIQVAARLVYSYFIEEQIPFHIFLNCYKAKFSWLNVSDACSIIRQRSGKERIVVLADNIANTNDDLNNILTKLGAVLNHRNGYTILTSSVVSPINTSECLTRAGRWIIWLALKTLEFNDARSLFVPQYENLPCLDYLISDCGGSPRALELLSITLKNAWCNDYTTLLTLLKFRFQDYGYARQITLSIVSAALLKRQVCPSLVLEGCDHNCEELVAQGGFFNSFEPDKPLFVPVISPLQLSLFADKCLYSRETNDSLLLTIGRTLSLLLGGRDRTTVKMTPVMGFDKAFGLWEALVRLLHQAQGTQVLSINDLYPLCTKTFQDLHLVLGTDPYGFVSLAKNHEITDNVFYHCEESNPGFEFFYRTTCFEEMKDNQFQAVFCYETRYSPDGLANLQKRYSLAVKENRSDKVFFVYVLRRNATTDEEIVGTNDCLVSMSNEIPKNCIVLDRHSLRAAFGPSFADRLFLELQ
ncbi:hypothetical protein ROZALSC1DRAFT_30891, partial [Rozella allomycis CSF55]